MNVTDTPIKWVLVKIASEEKPYYKVFGTWPGSYIDSDVWKMNSGIKSVSEDLDYYYFHGFSGSCYKCHKKAYGCSGLYGKLTLNEILKLQNVTKIKEEDVEYIIKEELDHEDI